MSTKVELVTSGNMWKVLVKKGDAVNEGDDLFIMEVMKMEIPHQAPISGTVTAVHVENDQEGLDAGMVAVEID